MPPAQVLRNIGADKLVGERMCGLQWAMMTPGSRMSATTGTQRGGTMARAWLSKMSCTLHYLREMHPQAGIGAAAVSTSRSQWSGQLCRHRPVASKRYHGQPTSKEIGSRKDSTTVAMAFRYCPLLGINSKRAAIRIRSPRPQVHRHPRIVEEDDVHRAEWEQRQPRRAQSLGQPKRKRTRGWRRSPRKVPNYTPEELIGKRFYYTLPDGERIKAVLGYCY